MVMNQSTFGTGLNVVIRSSVGPRMMFVNIKYGIFLRGLFVVYDGLLFNILS